MTKKELNEKLGAILLWVYVAEVGFSIGIENVFISSVQNTAEFQNQYARSSTDISIICSVYYIVAAVSTLLMPIISQIAAQYTLLSFTIVLWLLGYLIASLLVGNFAALVAGTVLKAISIGIEIYIIPVYIERNCHTRHRRTIMFGLFQASVPLGAVYTETIISTCQDTIGRLWQLCTAPVFPICFILFYLPRNETSIIRIDSHYDFDRCVSHSMGFPNGTLKSIQKQFRALRKPNVRRKFWGAILVQQTAVLCGVPGVIRSSKQISKSLGLPIENYVEVVLYALAACVSVVAVPFMHRFPKKVVLQVVLVLMGFMYMILFILNLIYGLQHGSNNNYAQTIAILAVSGLLAQAGLYFGSINGLALVCMSEVLPRQAQGICLSISLGLNWMVNSILNIVIAQLCKKHAEYMFLALAYTCFILFVLISVYIKLN